MTRYVKIQLRYGRKVNNQAIEETDRKGCSYPPAQMDRDPSLAWPAGCQNQE